MRYKVGEKVFIHTKSAYGVIIDRNVVYFEMDGRPFIEINYLVKPDGAKNFNDYVFCSRKDIQKEQSEALPDQRENWIAVELGDGFSAIVYSYVSDGPRFISSSGTMIGGAKYGSCCLDTSVKKILKISYAICSKDDAYDVKEGLKICRSRVEKNPMCVMFSEFEGDFDTKTVDAIIHTKAEYIKSHRNRFVNKRGKHHVFSD